MAIQTSFKNLFNSLSTIQKNLLKEYYALVNSTPPPEEDEIERISAIWDEAKNDSLLRKYLELIDLYSVPSIEVTKEEEDRWAYWTEYLIPELQAKYDHDDGTISVSKITEDSAEHILISQLQAKPDHDDGTISVSEHTNEEIEWEIECPNAHKVTTITLPRDALKAMQYKNLTCSYCEAPYDMHSWKPANAYTHSI
jgi:hypothetical protein